MRVLYRNHEKAVSKQTTEYVYSFTVRPTVYTDPDYTRVQGQGQSQLESTATKDGATEHQRKEIVCMYKILLATQASLINDTMLPAQKLKKVLKILDPLDCSWKHRETSSTRQSDTCMWLPETNAYRSWREGKDTFLWLQGKGVSFDSSNNSLTDTNSIKLVQANQF